MPFESLSGVAALPDLSAVSFAAVAFLLTFLAIALLLAWRFAVLAGLSSVAAGALSAVLLSGDLLADRGVVTFLVPASGFGVLLADTFLGRCLGSAFVLSPLLSEDTSGFADGTGVDDSVFDTSLGTALTGSDLAVSGGDAGCVLPTGSFTLPLTSADRLA